MRYFKLLRIQLSTIVLVTTLAVPGYSFALLLPAVQAAREAPRESSMDIPGIGAFDVASIGGMPVLTLDYLLDSIDIAPGETATIPTELIALDLRSLNPVEISGSFFDVFIEYHPPDPIIPSDFVIKLESESEGSFDVFFDIDIEVKLVDVLEPSRVTGFIHNGVLGLSGNWHIEKDMFVMDNPIIASGLIDGQLSTVPVPAAAWLFISGALCIGGIARHRKSGIQPG
ncbi:MAG: hypothetical protein WBN96_15335 [Gammaproteobacteria bacterium]